MENSPPAMSISKIHLHVEQFSLKTNWRLAEKLLYNLGCKKDTWGIRQVGKRRDQVRTCALGRGLLEEKGDYRIRDPLWGASSSSHILGGPGLGSNKGKMGPFAGWKTGGTNGRAVGSLGSPPEEQGNTCLLLKQEVDGRLKPHGWLTAFL